MRLNGPFPTQLLRIIATIKNEQYLKKIRTIFIECSNFYIKKSHFFAFFSAIKIKMMIINMNIFQAKSTSIGQFSKLLVQIGKILHGNF